MAIPSLVAFGSLTAWPGLDQLSQLRTFLRQEISLEPVIKALDELPQLCKALASRDPALDIREASIAADQLKEWISGCDGTIGEKRNVMTMPMTIIAQIIQYFQYLQESDTSHASVLESVSRGIQGFCAGLLSAIAVASGKSEEEVGTYAAISVKLAFCIGVYVDANQSLKGGSSTLALRWKTPTVLEDIQRLLARHPHVRFPARACMSLTYTHRCI